ncbi:hypothetical protein F5879DRAFT_990893 [Lentinula edodes]|nr:hypothetical protein F5879DRAFT_990893 [Lentinula edodes]
MDDRAHFNSAIRFVRSTTTSLYTPRVDSYYDQQSHILHYDVDVPGIRRVHLRAILGYSAILQHRHIAVWGVSLAPQWTIQNELHSPDSAELPSTPVASMNPESRKSEPDRPFSFPTNASATGSSRILPIVGTVERPLQQMSERNHGEFYRLLNVPAKTKVSDVNVVLANGILRITIKCNKPLSATEILATQEIIEVH